MNMVQTKLHHIHRWGRGCWWLMVPTGWGTTDNERKWKGKDGSKKKGHMGPELLTDVMCSIGMVQVQIASLWDGEDIFISSALTPEPDANPLAWVLRPHS